MVRGTVPVGRAYPVRLARGAEARRAGPRDRAAVVVAGPVVPDVQPVQLTPVPVVLVRAATIRVVVGPDSVAPGTVVPGERPLLAGILVGDAMPVGRVTRTGEFPERHLVESPAGPNMIGRVERCRWFRGSLNLLRSTRRRSLRRFAATCGR